MLTPQVADAAQHAGATGLDAAMLAIDRLGPAVGRGERVIEQQPHIGQQRRLVLLQRQHMLGLAVEQSFGSPALAVHGIGGRHPACQVKHGDEGEQGVDLVAALVHSVLAQDQSRLAGPGADEMQRRGSASLIERPPDGLAVQGNDASGLRGGLGELGHEALEGGMERRRVQQAEQARERVMARDAVLQAQHLAEQPLFGEAELGHVHAALRPADAGRDRDEQHLNEVVASIADARVFHRAEANTKPAHPCAPPVARAPLSINIEPGKQHMR